MTDNSILNMVGGEKHINPHYDIKEESANKGFTGIEVNGVRFSNIQEMPVYMDKQRNEIILLEKENAELKGKLKNLASVAEVRLANWQKYEKENKELKDKLEHRNCVDCSNHSSNIKLLKAKEIIRNLLRVTYGEGWNYSLDVKVKAEQFLAELD